MLRLIVKVGGQYKTFAFACEELEKEIRRGYGHKLAGIEVLNEIVPLPEGSASRLVGYERIIPAIKAIRTHTGWGLQASKDFVESAPVDLPPGLDAKTMACLISDLREAGATVALPIESETGK